MTEGHPICTKIRRAAGAIEATISLPYDARLLRRKDLVSDQGVEFSVELDTVYSLQDGDAFEFDDGMLIGVIGADELLLEVTGDLVRLAWHLGNRGTPCQINSDHILIKLDHGVADMVRALGGVAAEVSRPFRPEAGAYGMDTDPQG